MKLRLNRCLVLLMFAFTFLTLQGQQRFPKPEFESGYEQPSPTTPEPRSGALEYFDVFVLLAALSLATWLLIKKRSRRGILWLSIFSVAYFGFYRNGCICSVGSIQNVTQAIFDSGYTISVAALAFFLLPLVFSLFFGRIFCSSVCPLGAIQDLLIIKPITVSPWVKKTLSFIPHVYLGLAVLFAATGTDYIICRYDPFVGIFRLDAPWTMIFLGAAFLILGLFFARPYCRTFCPYGVLLNLTSRFSAKHMSITPSSCINCKLCTNSCPFDAIDKPVDEKVRTPEKVRSSSGRYIIFALLIPVWMLIGSLLMSKAHVLLSRAHPDVYLAELLITNPEIKQDLDNLDVQAFLESGKSMNDLVAEAEAKRAEFKTGSLFLGAYLGLIIGWMIMNQFLIRRREEYTPNKGECFSCGRCMDYCPVEK